LLDPFNWAFLIAGAMLWARSRRLAADARQILPGNLQTARGARKVCGRGLLGASAVYALVLVVLVAAVRYDRSTSLLEPGVDPRRENEARLAMQRAGDLSEQGDFAAAERSMRESLRLWEELTAKPSAPAVYRGNLAMTLKGLGWLRQRQGRLDEAERYYARAVALADQLAGDRDLDAHFIQSMTEAREALAALREVPLLRRMEAKDAEAVRKFEEAEVKAAKGDVTAESLYREAIALWEEVLPHATNPEYRKDAVPRLATAYLVLGELQKQLGKVAQAEETLKRAIDRGEEAVALDPDRPLPGHNLEVARRTLEELHEHKFEKEANKLCDAHRFADAIDLYVQAIDDLEEKARSGKDRDAAVRGLASRLDRFAWFLAHCPDDRLRDPKTAVRRARRATELEPNEAQHWYTLAMVQYRNRNWRDSLTSLETLKKGHELGGSAWLLVAMNRHRLGRKEEARTALRRAVEWIEEQDRKAEGNALLRFQYEMMRPALEALRREAESLIEGKEPADDRVG
jgi:tetratricopeptide (TPR) repeat protein